MFEIARDLDRIKDRRNDFQFTLAAALDPIQIARYLKYSGMPAAPPSRALVKMRLANEQWC